ncbi:hypothetical protein OKA06_00825 [Novosphingobium sp. MW5]|nr:hypothetical protein [Novosphingobium sp. MW5]
MAFSPVGLEAYEGSVPQRAPLAPDGPRIDILIDAPETAVSVEPLSEGDVARLVREQTVSASLPPQPLGQFVETVFGQVLGVSYILGPGVAQRRDIISMSGPRDMSARQFFALAEKALNQYGLVLSQQGGGIVVRETSSRKSTSRTTVAKPPETVAPAKLVHVSALASVSAEPAGELLKDLLQGQGAVSVSVEQAANGVVLEGSDGEVATARRLLDGIDRPEFAGMRVARIVPVLWNADALAGMLREVLGTEGYAIGSGNSGGTNLIHVPQPDCLLLFSDDARLFDRVLYWAKELDSLDGAGGDRPGYFVYQVKNTTAAELGNLVSRATADSEATASESAERDTTPISSPNRSRSSGTSSQASFGRESPDDNASGGQVVVDTAGNRILFRGTRREFSQMLRLLQQLDVAPKQVLVEITIAEVSLTDETRFGMEWFFDRQLTGGGSVQATLSGGSGPEAGGLGITFARGFNQTMVTATLNAIATNQNLNIISTPRLLARSGGQAQILIGNDVPIITSQRAAEVQTSGDSDILQTVQYRQTGVILNIRPVVLNDDRIDIEIFQEVSSQQPNLTSAISSPVISNRSVKTRLSLRQGMTAVLGGMMQDSQTMGQKGVPVIKDIPLLGRAFRTDSASKRKTELLILVTPRVIKEDSTMQNLTSSFSSALNGLMQGRGQRTFTLLPWMPGQKMPEHTHFTTTRTSSRKD